MGSVRIPVGLEEKIKQVASRKGITRSEVFRIALEAYCENELTPPSSRRFDDVIGAASIPGDLSTRTREILGGAVEEKSNNSPA